MQAVVFDLDGVPVDSEEPWDEVRRELAADPGVRRPDRRRAPPAGASAAKQPDPADQRHDPVQHD